MTPDSLECESPWSFNLLEDDSASLMITTWQHGTNNYTYNNRRPSVISETLPRHFITIEEKHFEDSLND